MRFIVLLLITLPGLFVFINASDAQAVNLEYRVGRQDSCALKITILFDGDASGNILIHLPDDYSGQHHLYSAFSQFQPLTDHTTVEKTANPDTYRISYTPRTKVAFCYILSQGWQGPLKYPNFYRPVIKKDWFYFEGYAGLAYPDLASPSHISCKLLYEGFAAGDFLGNSLFADKNSWEGTISLDELMNSIFCGGNFRHKTISLGRQKLTVAVCGQFTFSDETFYAAVEKIVMGERQFWNDAGPPYYFTLLMPTGDQESYGGTAYTNSFSIFQSPDVKLTGGTLQTISHEYFHSWLGRGLKMPAPQESYKWLSEGFTDYYSMKILFNAGIISKADYEKQLNLKLRGYYLSAKFNSGSGDVVGKYWESDDWRLLSYGRGLAIALMLDVKIMERKAGSLDDLMRTLYQESKPRLTFSMDRFDSLIAQAGGKEALLAMDKANAGNNDLLTGELLKNRIFPMAMKTVTNSYDMGFDILQSKKNRKITGLMAGSSAAMAGIKENMKFLSFRYQSGRTEPATVVVMDDAGVKRDISYMPLPTGSNSIPQILIMQ